MVAEGNACRLVSTHSAFLMRTISEERVRSADGTGKRHETVRHCSGSASGAPARAGRRMPDPRVSGGALSAADRELQVLPQLQRVLRPGDSGVGGVARRLDGRSPSAAMPSLQPGRDRSRSPPRPPPGPTHCATWSRLREQRGPGRPAQWMIHCRPAAVSPSRFPAFFVFPVALCRSRTFTVRAPDPPRSDRPPPRRGRSAGTSACATR